MAPKKPKPAAKRKVAKSKAKATPKAKPRPKAKPKPKPKATPKAKVKPKAGGPALAAKARAALALRVPHWFSEGTINDTPVSYTIEDGVMTYRRNGQPRPIALKDERMIAGRFCPGHKKYLDALEACRKLIAAGAPLAGAAQDLADLEHPIIAAVVGARGEELPRPRRATADPSRLFAAVRAGNLRDLTAQIAAGVDVNSADKGWTALLSASREAFRPGVEALLAAGADVHARLPEGFNALHLVIAHTQNRPLNFRVTLQRDGKSVTLTDRAEIRAATGGHPDDEYDDCVAIARLLIERGIAVDQETSGRQTPLSHAASHGTLEITELLLATRRVALDSQDKDGVSPLHYASRHGHVGPVRALLAAGARPDIAESYGFTPLHEAAENGHADVARALLDAGADRARGLTRPFERYPAGATPLDIARQKGHAALVSLLS